jgi:hypothetical protein
MKVLDFGLCALSCCAAAAIAGCGGPQVLIGPNGAMPQGNPSGTKTFFYTGAEQKFTVPTGVTSLTIAAAGASTTSAHAGLVKATIPVTPGELLAVFVGGAPNGSAGGFNGGGNGGSVSYYGSGGGGGGASDVRQGGHKLADRVVVAGGAGGSGGNGTNGFIGGSGAAGGGLRGGRGRQGEGRYASGGYTGGNGGAGGTQHVAGIGGAGGIWIACGPFSGPGTDGALGVGGNGGGSCPSCDEGGGGGGGGGYYGGGGGGSGSAGAGGGGAAGSGFAEARATNVRMLRGDGKGPAKIVISW